ADVHPPARRVPLDPTVAGPCHTPRIWERPTISICPLPVSRAIVEPAPRRRSLPTAAPERSPDNDVETDMDRPDLPRVPHSRRARPLAVLAAASATLAACSGGIGGGGDGGDD